MLKIKSRAPELEPQTVSRHWRRRRYLKSSNPSRAEPAVDKVAATTSKVVGSNKPSISLLEGSSSTTRNLNDNKTQKKNNNHNERDRDRDRETERDREKRSMLLQGGRSSAIRNCKRKKTTTIIIREREREREKP